MSIDDERGDRAMLERMRRSVTEMVRDVRRDQRRGMDLLEEQIASMGADCPCELLDAYDNLAKAAHDTGQMLTSLQEEMPSWEYAS